MSGLFFLAFFPYQLLIKFPCDLPRERGKRTDFEMDTARRDRLVHVCRRLTAAAVPGGADQSSPLTARAPFYQFLGEFLRGRGREGGGVTDFKINTGRGDRLARATEMTTAAAVPARAKRGCSEPARIFSLFFRRAS